MLPVFEIIIYNNTPNVCKDKRVHLDLILWEGDAVSENAQFLSIYTILESLLYSPVGPLGLKLVFHPWRNLFGVAEIIFW